MAGSQHVFLNLYLNANTQISILINLNVNFSLHMLFFWKFIVLSYFQKVWFEKYIHNPATLKDLNLSFNHAFIII